MVLARQRALILARCYKPDAVEAAFLAGLIRSPNRYNPYHDPADGNLASQSGSGFHGRSRRVLTSDEAAFGESNPLQRRHSKRAH